MQLAMRAAKLNGVNSAGLQGSGRAASVDRSAQTMPARPTAASDTRLNQASSGQSNQSSAGVAREYSTQNSSSTSTTTTSSSSSSLSLFFFFFFFASAGSNSSSDVGRDEELQALAKAAVKQKGLLNVPAGAANTRVSHLGSVKFIWKDLREHSQSLEIVYRAVQKFGDKAAIFAESCASLDAVKFSDRTLIENKEHLIFWQMPPSAKVFQEILARNANCNVYLIGAGTSDCDEPSAFLKKMFGLIRYAVNKKDGQIEGEKLAAALGASKMSVALGLTILRRVNLIDWFSEDGCIFLELTGTANQEAEELAEYKQLMHSLSASKEFRTWCVSSRLEDIQLAVTPNHVGARLGGFSSGS